MAPREHLDATLGEREYILVVEDDRDIQEAVVNLLEDFGYAVRIASNGKDALAVLTCPPLPRMILLDLMMPIMDGAEFIDRLAEMPSMASLPICMLTAAPQVPLKRNVVAVLRKPFDEEALMKLIELHCSKPVMSA